jgi:3-isopropylmalate/(R)-2-methylmalate dehydratase small subunit
MQPFTELTAIAAPLPLANVDTDKIIPARFLKTIKRSGLGKSLFAGLRYDDEGKERPDFVLNQEPFRGAQILVAHENFGCGSSREHAPWALLDFGLRCVIAPSFADIFHGNCFKNGILPIVLPRSVCDQLMEDARLGANARITVDLGRKLVVRPNGRANKKQALLSVERSKDFHPRRVGSHARQQEAAHAARRRDRPRNHGRSLQPPRMARPPPHRELRHDEGTGRRSRDRR